MALQSPYQSLSAEHDSIIPPAPSAKLHRSHHGKSRVRVAKVTRAGHKHTFTEYTVEIALLGGSAASFTHADNSHVVATDTCKNHVYLLAKTHPCASPETFALDLAAHFLRIYPWLTEAHASVVERPWRRATVDARPHAHGFALAADGTRSARVRYVRGEDGRTDQAELVSALASLSVLKTTQSGWANFVRDQFTTLPETAERVLATTVAAEWTYQSREAADLRRMDFAGIHSRVRRALLREFYGPPGQGHFSPGVQNTLFCMGTKVVDEVGEVAEVTLSLPNLHFLPCQIPAFDKNGVKFEDDVFIPTDEPHGIISATVGAGRMAKM